MKLCHEDRFSSAQFQPKRRCFKQHCSTPLSSHPPPASKASSQAHHGTNPFVPLSRRDLAVLPSPVLEGFNLLRGVGASAVPKISGVF